MVTPDPGTGPRTVAGCEDMAVDETKYPAALSLRSVTAASGCFTKITLDCLRPLGGIDSYPHFAVKKIDPERHQGWRNSTGYILPRARLTRFPPCRQAREEKAPVGAL